MAGRKYEVTDEDAVIGTNVREMRRAANLTQEEVAKKIGISARTLKRIEAGTGMVSVAILRRLAELFPELSAATRLRDAIKGALIATPPPDVAAFQGDLVRYVRAAERDPAELVGLIEKWSALKAAYPVGAIRYDEWMLLNAYRSIAPRFHALLHMELARFYIRTLDEGAAGEPILPPLPPSEKKPKKSQA